MPNFIMEAVARAICMRVGYDFSGGIGEGSFKETYLVVKPEGTKLALKIIKPRFSPERSGREVEAMKLCSHPNIASLLELAEFDHESTKYIYLVEAFMEGGTLANRLRKGLLDRDAVLELGEVLIGALSHIADNGLVHRDFKPDNIMFRGPDNEGVIVDFGIVRDLRKDSITKTYVAMGPGTPYFAAPEQLNNDKPLIDWRTDQFALGVTLALSHLGLHPYAESGEDDPQTVARVAAHKDPAAKFRDAIVSSNLPVLGSMVAPWPAERIRTPVLLAEMWRKQKGNN